MPKLRNSNSQNIFKTWILIFLFVGFVSGVFYTMSIYLNQPGLIFVGLFLSLGQAFIGYFFGHKIALSSVKAEEVSSAQAPKIHQMVDALCNKAKIPKPKIYISPNPSANAFATGRSPKQAHVCLNQGILDLLNPEELEGVIAHELSHIKNRDILVMTITMVLASVITFVTDIGMRMIFFGGFGKNNERENKNPIGIIVYILILIISPIVALIIQMAVSRQREYLADADAAFLTRNPSGLISGLKKLYNQPKISSGSFATSTSMNHFYISPPAEIQNKLQNLFNTHPSIADRVRELESLRL